MSLWPMAAHCIKKIAGKSLQNMDEILTWSINFLTSSKCISDNLLFILKMTPQLSVYLMCLN